MNLPQTLPIHAFKDKIIGEIATHQVIVVAGETGCGKTTQLPQFCLSGGRGMTGKIGVTQPRRIAAVSIAQRIAAETGRALGDLVGHKVRFSDSDSKKVKIKIMTDGILLAECSSDFLLRQYDTIIIDEAHERNLNIDLLLGHLKKILPKRPDLKVIISSATIDTQLFSKFFDNAPIISIAGRTFPVELIYDPIDDELLAQGSRTYIDAAVESVDRLYAMAESGDILIFMPTEHDIIETRNRLAGKNMVNTLVLPLFSRLGLPNQQLIFSELAQRKIVIATNIAETSITVPGIRFVIDTGLARVKEYNAVQRVTRLPVGRISRASADQRKGRCGRVAEGVCIRLYSAEDYSLRDEFTPPEIRRSGLAGVILNMMAQRMGDVATFPFVQTPDPASVRDGYSQLVELGALDANKNMTPLGRKMARLPLDPHISSIVLHAVEEGALREVSIIAAGLSVMDVRVRPPQEQTQADQAHAQFKDIRSDFILYVKIWDAYHVTWKECRTQNQLRKFCTKNYLSYNRMNEWIEVHRQIRKLLVTLGTSKENTTEASYDAIHRSLLCGLVGNIAKIDEQVKHIQYKGGRGRELFVFPGSVLHKKKTPWILCAEVVETSLPFARVCASIDPTWIEACAPHLMRYSYSEPFFEERSGSVKAWESATCLGLPVIARRQVGYGRINRTEAADIFIREGLVAGRLAGRYEFVRRNDQLLTDAQRLEQKLRCTTLVADESALCAWYRTRIGECVSVGELDTVIRSKTGDRNFLRMSQSDVLDSGSLSDGVLWPDTISIGGEKFDMTYTYAPGSDADGATLTIPTAMVPFISEHIMEWAVPGLRKKMIAFLLESLPKAIKKQWSSLAEVTEAVNGALVKRNATVFAGISDELSRLYKVQIPEAALRDIDLPDHLRMRVVVTGANNAIVGEARSLAGLGNLPGEKAVKGEGLFELAFSQFKKTGLTSWSCGDLPERIDVAAGSAAPTAGFAIYGYHAIRMMNNSIDCILCSTVEQQTAHHGRGVRALVETVLATELAWAEKDLSFDKSTQLILKPWGGAQVFREQLFAMACAHLFDSRTESAIRTKTAFDAYLMSIKSAIGPLARTASGILEQSIVEYLKIQTMLRSRESGSNLAHVKKLAQEFKTDLELYFKNLTQIPPVVFYALFTGYPRYLKAFGVRVEKAFSEVASYRKKCELLAPFRIHAAKFVAEKYSGTYEVSARKQQFVTLVHEYEISVFAQQSVKTSVPVSEKKLLTLLAEI